MSDRGHLLTEQPNPDSAELDALPLELAFDVMNAEDRCVAQAVAGAKDEIVAAIRLVSAGLRRGGRLIYVGAGTSGRLGVLDAAECPPSFLCDPRTVQGLIAGGDSALKKSAEHREDDPEYGAAEIDRLAAGPHDTVLGIATGGTTPFVHGALRRGRERGARTVFLACVPEEEVSDEADVSIRVLTGPEVISGSTRLKAGLATKMVLNLVSTLTMVQLGKVYGNLMVDVNARGCAKLVDRAIRTTMAATGLERAAARDLLERADWHVKTAVVMQRLRVERDEAVRLLEAQAGHLRRVLERVAPASSR
ncbi:MAG: N-acetylmuramic acid 6-phosphate etherase [Phycisphaerae bacterium]|nr:N-acetylmuramic acid 6-phosphate etherase [Phycisphaerae bacterium]